MFVSNEWGERSGGAAAARVWDEARRRRAGGGRTARRRDGWMERGGAKYFPFREHRMLWRWKGRWVTQMYVIDAFVRRVCYWYPYVKGTV